MHGWWVSHQLFNRQRQQKKKSISEIHDRPNLLLGRIGVIKSQNQFDYFEQGESSQYEMSSRSSILRGVKSNILRTVTQDHHDKFWQNNRSQERLWSEQYANNPKAQVEIESQLCHRSNLFWFVFSIPLLNCQLWVSDETQFSSLNCTFVLLHGIGIGCCLISWKLLTW